MRNYFYTCPVCGSNLDPGEKCDCEAQKTPQERAQGLNAIKCTAKSKHALKMAKMKP